VYSFFNFGRYQLKILAVKPLTRKQQCGDEQ
jgi:hypothetical protein